MIRKSFHSAPHSLVQSAVAAVARQPGSQLESQSDVVARVSELLGTLPHPSRISPQIVAQNTVKLGIPVLSRTCIELLLVYAYAVVRGETILKETMSDVIHMSGCDPDWMGAVITYIDFVWSGKPIPYVAPENPPDRTFVYPLPEQDSFKVGILSDWGSGDDAAINVLLNLVALKPDLILHLGDIYYSGTAPEVQQNFVELLERYAPGIPVYNLPGNHDMYSGGSAYYEALATLNNGRGFANGAAATRQGASFFSLQNSWLQLQGMDTGFHDSDLFDIQEDTTWLQETEGDWHVYWLNQARADGRMAFLFSHHQAWSPFVSIEGTSGSASGKALWYNARMRGQLQGVAPGAVQAWFWGHEHVLEVFDPRAIARSSLTGAPGESLSDLFPWVPYAACVGDSGFTMLQSDQPYQYFQFAQPLQFAYNEAFQLQASSPPDGSDPIYDRGFTLLNVSKPNSATATYYRVPGWVPASGAWPSATPLGTSTISPA